MPLRRAIDAGTDTAAANQISVLEANQVKIDTSLFSDAFKAVYKADSLGTFSIVASADGTADIEDGDAFTIDAKTGEITSVYVMDADSTQKWSGDDDNPVDGDEIAAGGTIGQSTVGLSCFQT
jgi:phosphohistidine swiveling domain-containing protein